MMEAMALGMVEGWMPMGGEAFCDGSDGQEDELEDARLGRNPAAGSTMGEIAESNKVDPNSKDEDDLETALRRAGLRPIR